MIRNDVETIIREVSSWDGVTAHPHRFGGVEFRVGNVEIGHVHNFGLVDIPFTRKLRQQLVAAGEAQPHHILGDSGWISFYLGRDGDAAQALRLYRLSYIQKTRRCGLTAGDDLQALGFGPAIDNLLAGRAGAAPEA